MENARVDLGDGSLKLAGSGNPFGQIWLRVGEVSFPNEGWTDFVVVVLSWWTQVVLDLIPASSGTAQRPT